MTDPSSSPFRKSDINGLYYRKLNAFCDFRGQFIELWNDKYTANVWQEDDISISKKNVLRGFHLDRVATKLVTPIIGDIFIAFVDREFNCQSFYCTDGQRYQFYVEPNVGICHLVLSDIGALHYKQTSRYDINSQETIPWNDHRIDVHWPISNPILSERDCVNN
jgi:dTDP-4-dehydrorhamnose 3,5-epimerase